MTTDLRSCCRAPWRRVARAVRALVRGNVRACGRPRPARPAPPPRPPAARPAKQSPGSPPSSVKAYDLPVTMYDVDQLGAALD